MRKLSFVLCVVLCLSVFTNVSCKRNEDKITFYDIEFTLSDDYVLSGRECVTFYNGTDKAFEELKFNIFGNAFRKGATFNPVSTQYQISAYPNGLSYGEMSVSEVLVGERNLEFNICGVDKNILSVKLPEVVFPNESVCVEISYTLKLANVVARTGYNDSTINLASFYPILCGIDENGFYECVYYSTGDPFFSDVADYRVTATVNENLVIASAGKVESSVVKDQKITSTYSLKKARSFAMVLSSGFECVTSTETGTEINYYYYDDSFPQESLDYAIKSVRLFEDKFGDYPYPTYTVVQTEFVQGGMEFPTLVMISDELEKDSYGEVIVHETAHQWWQSVVGNNEIEFGFLDEGLAEYSVVVFYENYPEYGLTREKMIKSSEDTYKVFCSVYDKLFGSVNTVMLRPIKDFTSEYEYVNLSYVKPCIMYDYLRRTVGDKTFFGGLKKYYTDYAFSNAKPDDLVGTFEKLGAGTNGFFDSFFTGKVII
ncbi:MAG: M1 family metallopeptidase [Clostridiales bacterium]|nr:M1 family metallopeptidase [Clostridiales bacterium]